MLSGAVPGDGDVLTSTCRLLGVGCEDAFTPAPVHAPARYPVLMVNGIDNSPAFSYSRRILQMMRDVGGHDVRLATVPPFDAPRIRAAVLWRHVQKVRADTGAAKVNLICHSLGGLDCRYLVSEGGLHWDLDDTSHEAIRSSVASITMISTAHRGTPAADLALGYLPDGDRFDGINRIATLLGGWFTERTLQEDVHLREALMALSSSTAKAFNAEIVDAPGIYYQSWAGYSRPFGVATTEHDARLAELCKTSDGGDGLSEHFTGSHDYLALDLIGTGEVISSSAGDDKIVPNDGLAPVASARWGRFRGCIPADHKEQLGQQNLADVNVRSGFDVARFYTNIAGELSGMGF